MTLLTKQELEAKFPHTDGWNCLVIVKAKPKCLSDRDITRLAQVSLHGTPGMPVEIGYKYETDHAMVMAFRSPQATECPLGYMQGKGAA
jgi:hypothetical protein